MRRGARDSQVVNNFFTFATIIIISIVLLVYNKYILKDEDKNSVAKLECEKLVPTKTKVLNQVLLNKSINALNKGYYKLEGSYLKPLVMKSKIEDTISLDEANSLYIESIGIEPKKDIAKFLKIKYELVETDKKDSNKQNAGTLISSFRINSKEIFRMKTEFTFLYKNAIKDRINCSIKVYKNHVQK